MTPFQVRRIDHVVFRVRDLQASVGFYRRALGCEVARVREDLGLVHLRAGASMIDLVSVDGPLGSQGGAEGQGPSLYFADPDGNIIELKGPATPAASASP